MGQARFSCVWFTAEYASSEGGLRLRNAGAGLFCCPAVSYVCQFGIDIRILIRYNIINIVSYAKGMVRKNDGEFF